MNFLVNERRTGRITSEKFSRQLNEQCYESLIPLPEPSFPAVHVGAVNSLAIEAEEQRFLLSGGADSSIRLWDLQGQSPAETDGDSYFQLMQEIPRKTGHKFGISAISWWPYDNGLFVTSSFDGTVKVWDTNTFKDAYKFDLETRIYSLDISSVGSNSLVATAADHPFIRLLDLRTTSSSHTLTGHLGNILSVKWSPRNEFALASGGSDGTVRLWDIRRSNACVASLDIQATGTNVSSRNNSFSRAHRAAVNGLCWTEAGNYLISSGNDEKLRLWDLNVPGGRNMLVNYGPLVRNRFLQTLNPCLTPVNDTEEQLLFYPSDSGEILLLRCFDGKLIKRLVRGGPKTARSACIISRGRGFVEFYSGALDGSITRWGPKILDKRSKAMNSQDSPDIGPTVLDDIWQSIQLNDRLSKDVS